jgi:hypothetical protein
MGIPTAQVQSPQSSQTSGKTGGSTLSPALGQPMQGTQGAITFPGQGGQPAMGQPNPYPNTISSWDNPPTGMSTQPAVSGKGKGA